jgi:3-oxoacyl-[acyl-carrier protein] reductase
MEASHVFSTDALAGEVALVTGASRGIGAAIAAALARAGAHVVGTATTEAGAAAISHRLAEGGAGGRGAVLDVTDAARCEALVDGIVASQGKLSILVNNAGITRDALALRMKDADWDAVLATNLSAVFRLARSVLRGMMKARHGRIINITSVVGASGNAGQANYAAAKAGVAGMSRALAREIGSRGVTVNCVAPGFIETDMTRALGEAQTQALLGQIALARLGAADEVAAAVVFLASAAGAYVSGTTLHVNGGMYMA